MPDPMQFAIAIVEGVTGETLTDRPKQPPVPAKDPAAVARGKKGGNARAGRLTPEERKSIAKKATSKRWPKRS